MVAFCLKFTERNGHYNRLMKYIYGRNVFITGGSSGIGAAAAEFLAESGFVVFAASRNPPDEVKRFDGGGEIHPVALDVRDMSSVENAAQYVLAQADIGVILHCAGVGIACAGEEFPEDSVMNLMETNFIGVLRVNSCFLPHLRSRGCGLCIMVGSVAGVFPIPYQSHYSASKAALDLYSGSLRLELERFGVRVSLVMPGDTRTEFTGARIYAIDEASPFYNDCLCAVGKMEKDEQNGYPPTTVAKVILKLIEAKKPSARKTVGGSYKLLMLLRGYLPDCAVFGLLRRIYLR